MVSRNAGAILRRIAAVTFKSLPKKARLVLNGCKVRLADCGYDAAGAKILGQARADGAMVLLDHLVVEQSADNPDYLENLLAHELGHAYRARLRLDDFDDAAEEAATNRQVKAWGFRDIKTRRPTAAR